MEFYEIISVDIVHGGTLNKNWHSPMQKITTNKGVFIDNEPGKTFGNFASGFNWNSKIGNKVKAKIVNSRGHEWINIVLDNDEKQSDNLVTTSALAKLLKIPSKSLKQKLVDNGFIELQGDVYSLTKKGKEAGGQSRTSSKYGSYFMWPTTLDIK